MATTLALNETPARLKRSLEKQLPEKMTRARRFSRGAAGQKTSFPVRLHRYIT